MASANNGFWYAKIDLPLLTDLCKKKKTFKAA